MSVALDHAEHRLTSGIASDSQLTLGEYLQFLLPRLRTSDEVPMWPPDAFALCISSLLKSGSYCRVLNHWPPTESVGRWEDTAREIGKNWRFSWAKQSIPPEVCARWKQIVSFLGTPVRQIGLNIALCQALLEICSWADEACAGVGVAGQPIDPTDEELAFYQRADELLARRKPSSLCDQIDQSRAICLPKMRTPQKGLNIRSLSHNIAICSADEIRPRWNIVGSFPQEKERQFNLLLVPWPRESSPNQFRPSGALDMRRQVGSFTVDRPADSDQVVQHVLDLYAVSKQVAERIDGVILPELALSRQQRETLSKELLNERSFLIAGVGDPAHSSEHGQNYVAIDIPGLAPLQQHKHHPWKLDRSQIEQYGLGEWLKPDINWWEHINLENRELCFISLLPWLVLTPLVCEDLARPDPVGDLVRAVGPNLVIAILMDGPQIGKRWSARYAATLADDPGSSVLTLTSIGMSTLSHPKPTDKDRSRVIALWKDAKSTEPEEIELPKDYDGVVISLKEEYLEEWTADGRSDKGDTGTGGTGYPLKVHQVLVRI